MTGERIGGTSCCPEWTERISAYVDGEIDQGAAEHVREHLRGCSQCRAVARDVTAINQALRQLSTEEAPRALWAGVAERLEEIDRATLAKPEPKMTVSRRRGGWIGAAIAAALVVLLGVPLVWLASMPPRDVVRAAVQDFITYRAKGWTVDFVTPEGRALADWAQSRVAFAVPEPKQRLGDFVIGGVRLCWLLDRRLLGITYVNGNNRAVVYVMESQGLTLPAAVGSMPRDASGSIHHHRGYGVAVWLENDLVFVLVAAEKDFPGIIHRSAARDEWRRIASAAFAERHLGQRSLRVAISNDPN